MHVNLAHGLDLLTSHIHDVSVSALAAAVIMLGAVLLLELRTVVQLRHVVDNNLGRVFEQLDLLRFETQQLLEGQQSVDSQRTAGSASPTRTASAGVEGLPSPTAKPAVAAPTTPAGVAHPASPRAATGAIYQSAAALAATGASSHEIAERLGLASGEARLLSSLAQARARRLGTADA